MRPPYQILPHTQTPGTCHYYFIISWRFSSDQWIELCLLIRPFNLNVAHNIVEENFADMMQSSSILFSFRLFNCKFDREIYNSRDAFLSLWRGFSTKRCITTRTYKLCSVQFLCNLIILHWKYYPSRQIFYCFQRYHFMETVIFAGVSSKSKENCA